MEYQKYEFCKDVCWLFIKENKCNEKEERCVCTAKQFHHWLNDNGFKITKTNNKMKWYKSYQKQGQECKRVGNSFIVDPPLGEYKVIVCVKYRTYCASMHCLHRRQKEGKE